MIEIPGQCFDGETSASSPAILRVDEAGTATLDIWPTHLPFALGDLEISERVGNIPRLIRFPDGTQFRTTDNEQVDQILAWFGHARGSRWVHRLESRFRFVAIAVVVMAISAFGLVKYGIPYFANVAAHSVSAQTAASIDAGAMQILDKAFFKPSTLDPATQRRLSARFDRMTTVAVPGFQYELLFRAGGPIGANALALASGTIVMTDEMVQAAQNDEELVSVLAHEIGHVVYRHGLRRAFQSSVVALFGVMLTGDVSSAAQIVAVLPVILVEAQYSQNLESEADAYSLAYMQENKIDPIHFKNLMLRLEKKHGEPGKIPSFFATHPETKERVKLFERLGQQSGSDVK